MASTAKPTRTAVQRREPETRVETSERETLLRRIGELEAENSALKHRLLDSRYVPSTPTARASGLSERERRHLFMKYSNLRRY